MLLSRLLSWPRLTAVALTVAVPVFAGGPLGDEGTAIETSRFGVDLSQTPVWAGSRVTSLGGAYVAVAYDVDGMLQNPAAPAVRPDWSVTEFDYWLGLGVTFPSSLSGKDFFNSGGQTSIAASPDAFIYLTPALILQWGHFGFGATIEYQSYALDQFGATEGQSVRVSNQFTQTHLQSAYSFGAGQFVVGGGIRVLASSVALSGPLQPQLTGVVDAVGVGAEVGVLYVPKGQFFQLGLSYRSPISARSAFTSSAVINGDSDIVIEAGGETYYLPERAELPWDLNVGGMIRFGRVKPNGPWRSDETVARRDLARLRYQLVLLEDEAEVALRACTGADAGQSQEAASECEVLRQHYALARGDIEEAMVRAQRAGYWKLQEELTQASRRRAFVSFSLLVTGPVSEAVGVESFLNQTVQRSGEEVTFSPRLGSEIEPISDWLRIRSGTYLEPTRFRASSPRAHLTGGVDVPLGVFNVFGLWPDDYRWRLALSADVARDFFTWGVSLGGWYPRHRGRVQRPAREPEAPRFQEDPVGAWPVVVPDR